MKINNQISEYIKNNKAISYEVKKSTLQNVCLLLNPFAPHISSEIFQRNFNSEITEHNWPSVDKEKIKNPTYELVVQVNGKKKYAIEATRGLKQTDIEQLCFENFKLAVNGYKKVIFVQDKIINYVG
jgi:leucyl-tRNA synthetase